MSSSRRRPELRLSISQGRDGSQYHRGGTPEKSPSSGKYFLLTSPFIEQIIFGGCKSLISVVATLPLRFAQNDRLFGFVRIYKAAYSDELGHQRLRVFPGNLQQLEGRAVRLPRALLPALDGVGADI